MAEKINSVMLTNNVVAWCTFQGTGTASIIEAYNVTSVVDNGVGGFSFTLAKALPSTNYCLTLGGNSNGATAVTMYEDGGRARTTTSVHVGHADIVGNGFDPNAASFCVLHTELG